MTSQRSCRNQRKNSIKPLFGRGPTMNVRSGFLESIGNTPLIRLRAASDITGCDIYGKAEFLNPGGSIKDRAALAIINDAEQRGQLKPGGVIVEGTAGNVGIGIALVANARGYRSVIVMPDTQSQEKKDMLQLCGADLRLIPAVPYSNPGHYARYSGRLAEELGAFWANQFDNVANRDGHYRTTGPEIWEQTDGKVDGFTCAVGSGGTLGGIARALKERNPGVIIALSDPMGAALYNWFTKGELTAEGDSITEGIGQMRVTKNLEGTPIDLAYQITDEEALPVLFDLIEHEGLVLGGSSAINIVGPMRLARDLGLGKTIVTILADGGQRYQSKLFNADFLRQKKLQLPPWVKLRKTQCEQMSSGLPLKADIAQCSRHVSKVPEGDIGDLVPYNRGRRLRRPHFLRRRRVGHPFYVIVRGDDRRRPNVVVCFHYLDCFDTACRERWPRSAQGRFGFGFG